LLGIRLFFGIVPAILIAIALPFLFLYPITRKIHTEVRRKLEAMDAAAGAEKPA
jgi:Na+/melibiose symporter-like transporter